MRKLVIIIGTVAIALSLSACSNSSGQAVTSPLPTASVAPALCDARGRVLDVVGEVRAGAIQSKADVASRLRTIAGQLDSEATRLRTRGLTTAADKVRTLSAATTQLASAVEGSDTAAIVSAAAKTASAIESIPGCPSPRPST
ncbi:MAG TPA: hypothetical protein VEQ37_18625 [Actinomycetota bacterium]|nr:hypothetical protein [Actinomycetota bacterium]